MNEFYTEEVEENDSSRWFNGQIFLSSKVCLANMESEYPAVVASNQ